MLIFLINIILNVSTKLAITSSLSRLLHSLFLPSENVFFLANWMYPFIVILSFVLLVSKINSATYYYESIRFLIELLLKYLYSVKPRIQLFSV